MENIDKVIENLCNYINSEVESKIVTDETIDMVKALAELISARAL